MDMKTTEEKLKELAKEVTDAAEPVIREIKTKAEPVYDDVKTKAEPVIRKVKEKAAPAAEDEKKRSEKATRVAKSVGQDITLKAAKYKCKEEVFVQYNSHEMRTTDIVDKAKKDFVNRGHSVSDIKEIQVYIKPSDNAAYYVVNHSETGKVEF